LRRILLGWDLAVRNFTFFFYVPVTRVWVTKGSKGVPVGEQMAWLSSSNTGTPLAKTRVAEVTYWPVTQGPLAAGGGGSVHPITPKGLVNGTIGWPPTNTRGFGVVGVACPAWAHFTVAPKCNNVPGISSCPLNWIYR
jgi:hypothetical protein